MKFAHAQRPGEQGAALPCVDGLGNRLVLFCRGCNFRCPRLPQSPHYQAVRRLRRLPARSARGALAMSGAGSLAGGAAPIATPVWRPARAVPTPRRARCRWPRCWPCCAAMARCSPASPSPAGGDHPVALRDRPVHGHQGCAGSGPSHLPARQQRIPGETGWQRLLPVLDGAMIDLKGWRACASGPDRAGAASGAGIAATGWLPMTGWRRCGCCWCRGGAIFSTPLARWRRR